MSHPRFFLFLNVDLRSVEVSKVATITLVMLTDVAKKVLLGLNVKAKEIINRSFKKSKQRLLFL